MFICICGAKEEEHDEIRVNIADDKLNSRDCIYSFLSTGWCIVYGYARQKKDNTMGSTFFVLRKIIQSRYFSTIFKAKSIKLT